jgi:hypothetical protein
MRSLLDLFRTLFGDPLASNAIRGRRGRGRMVVGFTTTCAISAYHH